uniref:Sperm associated antigen 1 n=1 Tax=Oryzias latipes TaxID=8090 RepID=A0A3P9JVQ2_ORYLA
MMSSSIGCTHGVPVEHLDYSYIEKCTDAKHLEKILRELRSGKEGFYPHLITFCESHLERLNPKSRALWRENPAATAASLPKDEWSQIVSEMKIWEEETKKSEASLKRHPVCDDSAPPVRGSKCFIPLNKVNSKLIPEEEKNTSKCAFPPEYPGCMKAEGHAACKGLCLALCEQKLLLANCEQDKGDEAFRTKDFEEAAANYSRSISVLPSVATYQSQAEAKINLKHWHRAMADCQHMLQLEPGNKNALLCRAAVYDHMGEFQMASEDLRAVLKDEPANAAATVSMSSAFDEKVSERPPDQQHDSRRLFIHEAGDEEGNSSQEKQPTGESAAPQQKVFSSLKLVCL